MLTLAVAAAWAVHTLQPLVETRAYREEVTVRGARFPQQEPAVASQQTLAGVDIASLKSLLSNDPMRAIQALPAVATGDDFRSEFAVRGSGFHHLRFTFEGVPATFLLHTVQQVRDGGSIAMVSADVLSGISLLYGSYPQRYGGRLGAELDFEMREGARDRVQGRISVSGTDSSIVLEGPIGRRRAGSWLFSARKSYLDFLLERITDEENFGFSFADAQLKAVYDVSPRHRLEAAAIAGSSQLDQSKQSTGRNFLHEGTNAAQFITLAWRYSRSSSLTFTQRVAAAGNQFTNTNPAGRELGGGDGVDLTWRGDAIAAFGRLQIDTGAMLQRQSRDVVERRYVTATRSETRELYDASAVWSSAFAHARWAGGRGSMGAGARVDHWTLTGKASGSPWMLGDLRVGRGFTIRAGAGIHRQQPGFEHVLGMRAGVGAGSERAYHVDAGIEQTIGASARWQLTFYNRRERDVLRLRWNERFLTDAGTLGMRVVPWQNALDGSSRGVELLLQRRVLQGLSGWLSYAYGRTRYEDRVLAESFDGDFDQRHTVNAYASYRFSPRTLLALRFRSGTNMPAPGYFEERGGTYFLSSVRNRLRVPSYARLDLRGGRTFGSGRRRLTLFLEVINALNHENARFVSPDFESAFQVSGLFESMLPRLPSAGLVFEF